MFFFIGSIVAAMFFFLCAISVGRGDSPKIGRYIVANILIIIGIVLIICGTLIRAEEKLAGTPLRSIGPGKYTIIKVAGDDSFVTDARSTTHLILKDNSGKTKFYLLPTNELQGIPAEGGILEVSEIPSSTKMVFRK